MNELEGKEVEVRRYAETLMGVIIGCDYDVGITIVAKYNPDRYLYCSHGPSSPYAKRHTDPKYFEDVYRLSFKHVVDQLKQGYFSYIETIAYLDEIGGSLGKIRPMHGGGASAASCPFGQ